MFIRWKYALRLKNSWTQAHLLTYSPILRNQFLICRGMKLLEIFQIIVALKKRRKRYQRKCPHYMRQAGLLLHCQAPRAEPAMFKSADWSISSEESSSTCKSWMCKSSSMCKCKRLINFLRRGRRESSYASALRQLRDGLWVIGKLSAAEFHPLIIDNCHKPGFLTVKNQTIPPQAESQAPLYHSATYALWDYLGRGRGP